MDTKAWSVSNCSINKINQFEIAIKNTRFKITENKLIGHDDTSISVVKRMYEIRVFSIMLALLSVTWYIHTDVLRFGLTSGYPAILESTESELISILSTVGFGSPSY